MTYAEIREAMLTQRRRLDGLVRGLDRQMLESEPVCGAWSTRDVVGHLLDWQSVLLASVRFALGGPRPLGLPIVDGEAFNTQHAASRMRDRWSETKADFDASFEEALELLDQLTPEQLAADADFPWGEPGGTVAALLAVIPEHLDEHCAGIEVSRPVAVA